jgi:hypothetical protein
MLSEVWGTEVRPCDGMRVTWAEVSYQKGERPLRDDPCGLVPN